MLQIAVTTLNGELSKLEMESSATLAEVKEHVSLQVGQPPWREHLLHNGTLLANAASLATYNIENGTCLILIIFRLMPR